jgi:hypothetical protein
MRGWRACAREIEKLTAFGVASYIRHARDAAIRWALEGFSDMSAFCLGQAAAAAAAIGE